MNWVIYIVETNLREMCSFFWSIHKEEKEEEEEEEEEEQRE